MKYTTARGQCDGVLLFVSAWMKDEGDVLGFVLCLDGSLGGLPPKIPTLERYSIGSIINNIGY